jgi:ubiquinone/menaquinone biosynthesis C-methylase UbiE
MSRHFWSRASHERAVERFYSYGAECYGDFHQGYLNLGLWENGINDYVAAAENLLRRLGDRLGLGPGSHLLDVACGMGTQDLYLERHYGPLEIDALDVTWKHVERGLHVARQEHLEPVLRFRHGSATSLPFGDEMFSHVLCIEGSVHFDTRERFFREAARVLKPGGVIAIADYTLKRKPRNAAERFVLSTTCGLWKIPQENRDSKEAYQRKMMSSGLTNVTLEEVGRLTYPGYYREQRRPECRRELARIRGFVGGRLGQIADVAAFKAYQMGLVEYVLVRAEK